MILAIVGLGNVGVTVAKGLARKGVDLLLVSRDRDKAHRLAEEIGGRVATYEQVKSADAVILTVPDGVISDVRQKLGELPKNLVLVHTSGAYPASILEHGRSVAVHPVYSFPFALAPEELQGIYWIIEGEAVEFGKKLVGLLDGRYVVVKSSVKPDYHAVLVALVKGMLSLMGDVERAWKLLGLDTEIYKPMVKGIIERISKYPIDKLLTGPQVRSDTQLWELEVNLIHGKFGWLAKYLEDN